MQQGDLAEQVTVAERGKGATKAVHVSGGKVRRFWHSDACARYSVPVPAMKIGANGGFSFTGTGIKNGILQEYTVKVSGKAVSRTVIAGSMTYQKTAGNGPGQDDHEVPREAHRAGSHLAAEAARRDGPRRLGGHRERRNQTLQSAGACAGMSSGPSAGAS